MEPALPDTQEIQSLYDRGRYLDAYRATERLWREPSTVERLDVPTLLLSGRLAYRLGSFRLRQWLSRKAQERAPDDPSVVYYARGGRGRVPDLIAELAEFDRRPDLESGDPAYDAMWWASRSVSWSRFRDFERAHEMLRKAHGIEAERAWTLCCEAAVCFHEHCWEDALSCVERGWALHPALPQLADGRSNFGADPAVGRQVSATRRSAESPRDPTPTWIRRPKDGGPRERPSRFALIGTPPSDRERLMGSGTRPGAGACGRLRIMRRRSRAHPLAGADQS